MCRWQHYIRELLAQLRYNGVHIDLHRDWSTALESWVGLDANNLPRMLTAATALVAASRIIWKQIG
jgi:hypothetical protein